MHILPEGDPMCQKKGYVLLINKYTRMPLQNMVAYLFLATVTPHFSGVLLDSNKYQYILHPVFIY